MTLTRRALLAGATATLAAPAYAETLVRIPEDYLPRDIEVDPANTVGVIQVDTANTWLYHIHSEGVARRYKIAVGAAGRAFEGQAVIRRKAEWPSWRPTQSMIAMEPEIYGPYAQGLPGGHEKNPMGARALYLYRGGRDTLFRIHGTPQPWTMGRSFSSGCVRLINDHVVDLYDRVPVGTVVVTV